MTGFPSQPIQGCHHMPHPGFHAHVPPVSAVGYQYYPQPPVAASTSVLPPRVQPFGYYTGGVATGGEYCQVTKQICVKFRKCFQRCRLIVVPLKMSKVDEPLQEAG